jgi:hypothetical protein
MGLTVTETADGNPATPEVTEKLEFLVDSGATDSGAPTPTPGKRGIKALEVQEFRQSDGTKISRRTGGALFEYRDLIAAADAVFGQALGPLQREPKPLAGIPAGARWTAKPAARRPGCLTPGPGMISLSLHSSPQRATHGRLLVWAEGVGESA